MLQRQMHICIAQEVRGRSKSLGAELHEAKGGSKG